MRLLALLACGLGGGSLAANSQEPLPRLETPVLSLRATVVPFSEKLQLGAEFLYRNVSWQGKQYFLPGYVVVRVAIFGSRQEVNLAPGQFSLRLNKKVLLPQAPNLIDYAVRRGSQPQLVLGNPTGPAIIVGGPDSSPRFPGDPRSTPRRLPRVPEPSHPEPQGELRPTLLEVLSHASLPAGVVVTPVEGQLYFEYREKLKQIQVLELVYHGPGGPIRLPLSLNPSGSSR